MLSQQLSVVSWNLLAPIFATPAKYPWATASDLDWRNRQAKIVSLLGEIDADVICLQEVETALWGSLLQLLNEIGYDGVLQETRNGHPVAGAVCVRSGAVEVVRTESRSRALITVLRASSPLAATPSPSPPPLYLANVHLEAGAEKGATRLAQTRSLLRRLELQCSKDVAAEGGRPRTTLSPRSDAADAPVLITGDFNCDRSSELYKLYSRGELPQNSRAPASRRAKPAILPLRDAYLQTKPPWGPALRSSYRNGRLLDYVWTSPAVKVLRTMPVSDLAGSTQPHQLPSAAHPSDHLPVGALISYPGAPDVSAEIGQRPAWQQLFVENVQRRK